MHKIKKGIKKKIKGKKGKDKEDDLFDPDQLAKFKEELEEKAAAAAAAAASHSPHDSDQEEGQEAGHSGQEPPQQQEDEEWQKFKLLTSGVDSILKKTSGDLDRIKSTSFFQRTPPNPLFVLPPKTPHHPPPPTRPSQLPPTKQPTNWVNPDAAHHSAHSSPSHPHEEAKEEEGRGDQEEIAKAAADESSEEDVVLEDDLFDTSLVDKVLTGNLQLAYIPDSPLDEEPGDDPFDTSVALHIVKQIEAEEIQKKRQVNLGTAVNVLTGTAHQSNANAPLRATNAPKSTNSTTRRPRPHAVNLLGDSDAPQTAQPEHDQPTGAPALDIFDAVSVPDDLNDLAILVQQTAPPNKPQPTHTSPDKTSQLQQLLSEFDVINTVDPTDHQPPLHLLTPEEELQDEFAALASQSLHKDPPPTTPSHPPPQSPQHPQQPEEPEEPEEDDPFDTKYVDSLVDPPPDDHDDFDFDPRAGEPESHQPTLQPISKDLLGGSCSDLASSFIHPETDSLVQTEATDPFDSSTLHTPLPGKAELKLLEQELLTDAPPPQTHDSDDFDPRKDEVKIPPARPPPRPQPPNKPPPLHPLDSIDHNQEELTLQPHVQQDTPDAPEDEVDPFDTSAVSHVILQPGKTELRLLESELVSPGQPPNQTTTTTDPFHTQSHVLDDDDFDFNPRGTTTHQLLDSLVNVSDVKTLTPTTHAPPAPPSPDTDPFDTSNFHTNNILPGKAELKHLEQELLSNTPDFIPPTLPVFKPLPPTLPPQPTPPQPTLPSVHQHLLEADEDWDAAAVTLQPLQPKGQFDLDDQPDFDDPFDTSIAHSILPGKAELALLEHELGFHAPNTHRKLSDPDFDPRIPVHPSLACQSSPLVPQSATQPPSHIHDPFDTSSSDAIPPGRAELKIIEAELL